ncbi:transposase [Lysinibacillus sphaericus]|uniref:transposase n=1 Tax=Lysinibacillus sphaericus TaxID=1421 RepID=UPI003F7B1492
MARKKRQWSPHHYNHVVMRGNNHQTIFNNAADYQAFFRVLQYAHQKYPFSIVVYCIMTNHFHLLIRSPEVPLGKVMAIINRRYSDYFKKNTNIQASFTNGDISQSLFPLLLACSP